MKPSSPTVIQLLHTRPWLTRAQSLSEQDLFILHSRDNLVSGATGPKDWPAVAAEYNERFTNELKKPLAWKTLSKRCGLARKIFQAENEEYAGVVVYPVPLLESDDRDGDADVVSGEEEEYEEGGDEDGEGDEGEEEQMQDVIETATDAPPPTEQATQRSSHTPIPSTTAPLTLPAASTTPKHLTPGFHDPSSTPPSTIPALTRAKFHLRHRTHSPVYFEFLSADEQALVTYDAHYMDAQILAANSALYARALQHDPNTSVIDVPVPFSVRTVNILIQLLAPVRATELPSHYLWKAEKPEPGVYDRFGGIEVEEIAWTIDVLLDLMFFARVLEVFWVVDMVVDRVHFLFTEQSKCRDAVELMIDVGGRLRMPVADTRLARVTAEDLEEDVLEMLAKAPVDFPTLRFVVDLLAALGGSVDAEWLGGAPKHVKDVFAHADDKLLVNGPREAFCERYHHHPSETCYTLHARPPTPEIINALYATATPQELVDLSDGVLSANSLRLCAGDVDKWKEANSAPEMLEAEKMLMEMETRIEETKAALRWAREAPEVEKREAIAEARKLAQDMYSPSQL